MNATEVEVDVDIGSPASDVRQDRKRPQRKRPRGTGCVYQQKGSNNWWIKYYRNGVPYRQSANTTNKRKAQRLLQRKIGEIATHNFVEPKAEKTLVRELVENGVFRDYTINGKKSLDDVKTRWKLHLEPVFGDLRTVNVSNDDVTAYIDKRQKEGAKNATINRELAILKRAFTLGMRARKVYGIPHFPRLEERNVRKGFVTDTQYDKLAAACAKQGLWLRAMFEVGYNFGWRVSELLNLRVRQVDLAAKTIRLETGETKNDEARTVSMTPLVYGLVQQCVTGKQPNDCVFTRGAHNKPIRDFRGTWEKVCEEAGVTALLFHDLRRTAVRNMVRNGIPERVAMTISGHKTRSVFDRYNIVSESDLRDAAAKLAARDRERDKQAEKQQQQEQQESSRHEQENALPDDFGHSSGIVGPDLGQVANHHAVN